jgi:hypothetical protein
VKDDNNEDDENIEEARIYGREHFGKIAFAYLTPYLYKSRYLDKVFRIQRANDDTFMIGDSSVTVDDGSNVIVQGSCKRGIKGYQSC